MRRQKILYVQPVQSPYLTPRLEALASDPELEIILVLEQDQSAHRPGWKPTPIANCTIEVLTSKVLRINSKHNDLGYDVSGVRVIPWRLPFVIWRHRPDVVVVCNATELLLASFVRKFIDFKIAINVEDTLHAIRNKSIIGRTLKAWVYRKADIQLAFSSQSEEYLRSIGISDSIRRTSWSLNLKQFERLDNVRETTRCKLETGNRLTFIFVGMLIPLKGIMPMLAAWAKMPPEFRANSTLVIVGEGSLETAARAYAVEKGLDEIIFVGRVPYASMPSYYAAADVFILPTLQDLFSLVVVEAMASGCAVMTSPYNGASELINEGENGWLFDSSNEYEICRVLDLAFKSREILPTMGRIAQADIQSFDTSHVMNKLAVILKNI